eukprot:1161748-Pelagomonas_calceolata.AAC.8
MVQGCTESVLQMQLTLANNRTQTQPVRLVGYKGLPIWLAAQTQPVRIVGYKGPLTWLAAQRRPVQCCNAGP